MSGGRPVCESCVRDVEWRAEAGWARYIAFAAISVGMTFWAWRHVDTRTLVVLAITVAVALLVGVAFTTRGVEKAQAAARSIARRRRSQGAEIDPFEAGGSPYRSNMQRVLNVAVPTVSARTTALVAIVLMLLSAAVVPLSVKLPVWIRFELVLLGWWVLLTTFLSVLLYRGTRVQDDHSFRVRWNLPDLRASSSYDMRPAGRSRSRWWDAADAFADAEGCAGLVFGLVLVLAAFGAAWLLAELVFPLVLVLVYWLVIRAVARVTNDRHGCERSASRAFVWGAFWATVYTVPFSLVVYAVHAMARLRG